MSPATFVARHRNATHTKDINELRLFDFIHKYNKNKLDFIVYLNKQICIFVCFNISEIFITRKK